MSKLARLLDTQQDCVFALEQTKNNLTKLTYERRTYETVSRLYHLGDQQWELVLSNHEKISSFGEHISPEYFNKFKEAQDNMSKIQQFCRKCFPELLIEKQMLEPIFDEKDDEKQPTTSKQAIDAENPPQPSQSLMGFPDKFDNRK